MLECRVAAMQRCGMATTIPLSKRGSLTLPPRLRRKLGLVDILPALKGRDSC